MEKTKILLRPLIVNSKSPKGLFILNHLRVPAALAFQCVQLQTNKC